MNINPFRYHVGIFRLGTCQKLAGGAGGGGQREGDNFLRLQKREES